MLNRFPIISLFVAVTLGVHAACAVLFRLSQLGPEPFAQLPLAVIVFFGILFLAPFMTLLERLEPSSKLASISLATATNLALWLVLKDALPGAELYILAPLAGVALALALPKLFGKHAPMLAAMSVYTVCTLLANYTFDSFLPVPLGRSLPFLDEGLVNVGTLFFGITFTQRDRIHHYGRRYVYAMIFTAAVANIITALSLGTPLRYVFVGFTAIIISEAADTEMYQRFIDKSWWTRVATSNAVSIPIDTILFTVLAFYGAEWATPQWMITVIVTDIFVKLIVGFLAAIRIAGVRSPRAVT